MDKKFETKELKKKNKKELIGIIIEYKKYNDDLETDINKLKGRDISQQAKQAKLVKRNEKLDTEKQEMEDRFLSLVSKIQSTSIYAGDNCNIQVGKRLSCISINEPNFDELSEKMSTILESNSQYLQEVLQRLAFTLREIEMMQSNLKHSLTNMSQEQVEVTSNLEKVLQFIKGPSAVQKSDDKNVFQQCIDSIRATRDSHDPITATTLPTPAKRLHRILVTKYEGKNEAKLLFILRTVSNPEDRPIQKILFEDKCAKALFGWCKKEENTASCLHGLLEQLDKDIIKDEKYNIMKEIRGSLGVHSETESQNQHSLFEIQQNQKLMMKANTELLEKTIKVQHSIQNSQLRYDRVSNAIICINESQFPASITAESVPEGAKPLLCWIYQKHEDMPKDSQRFPGYKEELRNPEGCDSKDTCAQWLVATVKNTPTCSPLHFLDILRTWN